MWPNMITVPATGGPDTTAARNGPAPSERAIPYRRETARPQMNKDANLWTAASWHSSSYDPCRIEHNAGVESGILDESATVRILYYLPAQAAHKVEQDPTLPCFDSALSSADCKAHMRACVAQRPLSSRLRAYAALEEPQQPRARR